MVEKRRAISQKIKHRTATICSTLSLNLDMAAMLTEGKKCILIGIISHFSFKKSPFGPRSVLFQTQVRVVEDGRYGIHSPHPYL